MSPRNLLNISLAIVLAGLFILIINYPDNEAPDKKLLLTALKPADISKIFIEQSGPESIENNIVLMKIKNKWLMKFPYKNQANILLINKVLGITQAKSHAQYLVSNINLANLKLKNSELTITLNDTKLNFGTTDAIKGHRYIQVNDTVHMITDSFSHIARGHPSSFLNPNLLPENISIKKIVLPAFTIQTEDKGWSVKPEDKTITPDQIQQFLDEWQFARAIRVEKLKTNTVKNDIVIEVHTNSKQQIIFGLKLKERDFILTRSDIGLRYYFALEAGEKMLKFQTSSRI